MLRPGPACSLARASLRFPAPRHASNLAKYIPRSATPRLRNLKRSPNLALVAYRPLTTSLQRHAVAISDKEAQIEKQVQKEELVPHPEEVTSTSTVRQVFHEKGEQEEEEDIDMLAGVKSDLRVIKETFALGDVPKDALILGMAGLLPYAATSATTLLLSYDINHAAANGEGFFMSEQTAQLVLNIVEPLQIGYGAVIISFLGAIHWGLEWAKFGGTLGYRRYAIGVVAPAVAWPTLLLPIEYGLIAQFSAFIFLYFADARAVVRGQAPPWYATYRFVLTFVVGASIVVSLIGRGQIADKISRLPSPADRIRELRESQAQSAYEEEQYKRKKAAEEAEAEDEDAEEADDE